MTQYDENFYDTITDGSTLSAALVVPLIIAYYDSWNDWKTLIDVGCGRGVWAKEFERQGLTVLGVDGDYVADPVVPFQPLDISLPFSFDERYDVALCLEVAEHLPEFRAASFVEDLCKLADVVIFSAAIPYQTGNGHINCQWPSYWAELFGNNGYGCLDEIRKDIWNDEQVEPWYRQNLLVFSKNAPVVPVQDLVHPIIHSWGR